MAIGVNQVEYSPTSTTGWYAGISPPVSGYTVYVNKVTQGPSILVASNDNDLVSIAISQGATSTVTTTAGALNYFASQSDMMVVNKNYNNIVTSGLVLNVDTSFVASYPVSGTSWYDISGSGNTGTLVNGPMFNTNGWISFDGVDDRFNYTTQTDYNTWTFQTNYELNFEKIKSTQQTIFTSNSSGGTPGLIYFEFTYSSNITRILTDSSNNLFVCGRVTEVQGQTRQFLFKLTNTGSLITNFNAGLVLNQTQTMTDIALDSQGNLYYVGYNLGNLIRVNSTTGAFIQQIATVNSSITQANLLLDEPNNRVYIGGWFTSIQGVTAQRIARLNLTAMTIDTTFNTTNGFPTEESVQMMALQSDGKLIVGGSFTTYSGVSYSRIIRLNSNGSIDTSFNPGSGFDGSVSRQCIQIQSDGKIICGGSFLSYSGVSANRIIRLNVDGTRDNGFVIGTGFNAGVFVIRIDSNGKILVGGSFSSYNGTSVTGIARLNSDGSIDSSFSSGNNLFNNTVETITIQSDGKILVGGNFTTYSGQTANQICRLNSNGTLDTSFDFGSGIFGGYRLFCGLQYRNTSNAITTHLMFRITQPTNNDWAPYETAVAPFLNKFFNFTITKNISNSISLYWNGIVNNTSVPSNVGNLNLIVNRSGTQKGDLNNYYLYNRNLSQSEILQNYYGGPIVTSGLTLAVDAGNLVSFQNGSGSTFSLVGSYTGTLTNGVSYTIGNGGGWGFDGTNDYITLGTQNFISSDFTLNIWFNTSTNSVKEHYLFSFGYNNTNSLVIAIDTQVLSGFASMSSYYNVGGVVTGRLITSSNFPNTNTIHFSFTRNNGINTCYINGVPQTSRIFTESVSFGSFVYDIGWATQRNKSTAYFQGNIYTTYIYNRALSASEVAQNFNAQKRRFGF